MLGVVISWACEHEHGQVSMSKGTWLNLFLNNRIFKNILSHLGQNIWWRGRIVCHMSWMNDIYGWKCGWKMTMDELLHEHSQQVLFCKKPKKWNRI
jgi:hypothetical protein